MPIPDLSRWGPDDGDRIIEAGLRMVRRPNPVWMMPLDESKEHRVHTDVGPLTVRSGEKHWLAHDPLSGQVWPVSEEYLTQHYELASVAEEAPDEP
jgi:hypothetical protein